MMDVKVKKTLFHCFFFRLTNVFSGNRTTRLWGLRQPCYSFLKVLCPSLNGAGADLNMAEVVVGTILNRKSPGGRSY